MIKFLIEESAGYRGGADYCTFRADNVDQVLIQLERAWYDSELNMHGGELFLTAFIESNSKKPTALYCGHAYVDEYGDLKTLFESPTNEQLRDALYSLGFFLDDLDGRSFNDSLSTLFEVDSPDRVIGAYLYKVLKKSSTQILNNKLFGKQLLANILAFANQYKVGNEIYEWFRSEEGKNYLRYSNNFKLAAKAILSELEKEAIVDLGKYIAKYQKNLGVQIILPSKQLP